MRYKLLSVSVVPDNNGLNVCTIDTPEVDTQAEVISALADANTAQGQALFWAFDTVAGTWFVQQAY